MVRPSDPSPRPPPLQHKLPGVLSMTDFVGWRFGPVAQWYFLAMVLFNMAIVALNELTTGALCFYYPLLSPAAACRSSTWGCAPRFLRMVGGAAPLHAPGAQRKLFHLPMLPRPCPAYIPLGAAGSLFQDYIGSEAWIIILLLGVLSLSYTAVGGLVVSIVTDQLQGGS